MTTEVQAVLEFWFGPGDDDLEAIRTQSDLWWNAEPAIDEQIRDRFGALHSAVINGERDGWLAAPEGRLAAIIVVDQFSRHLFRGDGQSYAWQTLGQQLCSDGIAVGDDLQLSPVRRAFFYLPLEHAESLDEQARSVSLNRQLVAEASEPLRNQLENYLGHALQHQQVIERFGRFPHRNALLGRENTAEERDYLGSPAV
ncbi:DUF924 family protein [Nevskia ramosa]|uniref:DUF924 family protein n=1 Tax=Nevskia ramosa TaxID=64002 RepID=UPI003D0E3E32